MEYYGCMKLCGKDGKTVTEAYKMLRFLFGPTRALEIEELSSSERTKLEMNIIYPQLLTSSHTEKMS
jgi:hypothetical protein